MPSEWEQWSESSNATDDFIRWLHEQADIDPTARMFAVAHATWLDSPDADTSFREWRDAQLATLKRRQP